MHGSLSALRLCLRGNLPLIAMSDPANLYESQKKPNREDPTPVGPIDGELLILQQQLEKAVGEERYRIQQRIDELSRKQPVKR